jgi:hypothetical protein
MILANTHTNKVVSSQLAEVGAPSKMLISIRKTGHCDAIKSELKPTWPGSALERSHLAANDSREPNGAVVADS